MTDNLEMQIRNDEELKRINQKTISQLRQLDYNELLAITASQLNGRRADFEVEADKLTQFALSEIQNINPQIYHFNSKLDQPITEKDKESLSLGNIVETEHNYLIPLRCKKSIDEAINSGYVLGFMEIKKEEIKKDKLPFLELYARSHGFTTHHGLLTKFTEQKRKEAELNQEQVDGIGDYLRHEIANPLNTISLGLQVLTPILENIISKKDQINEIQKQIAITPLETDILGYILNELDTIRFGNKCVNEGITKATNALEVTRLIGGNPTKLKQNADLYASLIYQICESEISNFAKNEIDLSIKNNKGNKTIILATEQNLESKITLLGHEQGSIIISNILGNCSKYCPDKGLVYMRLYETNETINLEVINTSERVYTINELQKIRLGKYDSTQESKKYGHGLSEGFGMPLIDLFMRKNYAGKLVLESGEKINLTQEYLREDVNIQTHGDPRISKIIEPYSMTRLEFPKENFVLHCAGGYRSMIAASLLYQKGIQNSSK